MKLYKLKCKVCKNTFYTRYEKQKTCGYKCSGKYARINKIRIGIKHPQVKYSYNREYFKEINTPQKAYWVGFILGDGHIRKKENNFSLQFCLAKKDVQLLYNFIDEIGGDYAQVKERYHRFSSNGMVYLKISSKQMVQDLIKIGVPYKNKTFTARVPKMPGGFISAFFLGLFDADGSVGVYNGYNNKEFIAVQMCGTKSICEGFSQFLGYNGKYVYKSKSIFNFKKEIKLDCDDVFFKLYKYDIPCLERKKNIFREWINAKNSI